MESGAWPEPRCCASPAGRGAGPTIIASASTVRSGQAGSPDVTGLVRRLAPRSHDQRPPTPGDRRRGDAEEGGAAGFQRASTAATISRPTPRIAAAIRRCMPSSVRAMRTTSSDCMRSTWRTPTCWRSQACASRGMSGAWVMSSGSRLRNSAPSRADCSVRPGCAPAPGARPPRYRLRIGAGDRALDGQRRLLHQVMRLRGQFVLLRGRRAAAQHLGRDPNSGRVKNITPARTAASSSSMRIVDSIQPACTCSSAMRR